MTEPQPDLAVAGTTPSERVPTEKKAWTKAFVKAQAAFKAVTATHKVQADNFSYMYADLPDVHDMAREPLAANGLAQAQDVTTGDGEVRVTTRIYHEGGWVETFGPLGLPAGRTPQQAGTATTYARRYALSAALGVASDEDTDARGVEAEAPKVEAPPAPDPNVAKSKEGVRAQLKTLIEDGVSEEAARNALRAVVDENGWNWRDFATKAKQAKLLAAARDWLAKVDDRNYPEVESPEPAMFPNHDEQHGA